MTTNLAKLEADAPLSLEDRAALAQWLTGRSRDTRIGKLSIFLSHINEDSIFADALEKQITRDYLGLAEVFVFSDRTTNPVGSKWLEETTKALRSADLHIILCSPESLHRPWIHFEAGAAHVRGIPIVPICHSGLEPDQLPVPLSEYQGISISDKNGFLGFYKRIADLLGSNVPPVDFEKYAREATSLLEERSAQRAPLKGGDELGESGLKKIIDPVALCVSSPQFVALGLENQLQLVIDAFPSTVKHGRVLDSDALEATLEAQRVDIVHVAAFVCPRSGDLYFSEVDLITGLPTTQQVDVIRADGFAALLKMARTQLVVITSCDAIALVATLITSAHVVAARDMVSTKMMVAWVKAFYSMLPKLPLSEALEFALKASGAPMRLYARQPEAVNFQVEMSKQTRRSRDRNRRESVR